MSECPPGRLRAVLLVFGITGLIVYAIAVVLYGAFPYFTDHTEPAIACVASVLFDGSQIYGADPTRAPAGLSYGPYSFLPAAVLLTIFPDPMYAPKLAGAVAGVLSIAVLLFCFRRQSGGWSDALIIAGTTGWWLLALRQAPFWARPDPFLLLAVSLGVATVSWGESPEGKVTRSPSFASGFSVAGGSHLQAFILGVLMGVAAGMKVHAFLPMLPLVGLLWHRHGWMIPALAIPVSVAAALAPFAFPNISLTGLFESLVTASRHGIDPLKVIEVPAKALPMVAPLVVLLLMLRRANPELFRKELRDHWAFWLAIPATLTLGIAVASKEGAGAGHLIPYAPLFAFAIFRVARLLPDAPLETLSKSVPWAVVVFAYALPLLFAVAHGQHKVWEGNIQHWSKMSGPRDDVRAIMRQLPGARLAMGLGNGPKYPTTFVRTDLVHAGHPYLLEPVAAMDVQAGRGEFNPEHLLDPRETDFWLIPKNQLPFNMANGYGTGPIFPMEFRLRFADTWEPVAQSVFFDIWAPRTEPPATPARAIPAPPP